MVDYGYAIICLSLVFSGLILNALFPVVNEISDDMNDRITAGDISEQTAGQYENATRIFKYIVPLAIVGICFVYGITRAQYTGDDY